VSANSFDLNTTSGQADAAKRLCAGEIVALPTDTVPGLAIRADLPQSAERLARMKGSPQDRPFTLHLPHMQSIREMAPTLPPGLAAWLNTHLPQGVTALLPRRWVKFADGIDWKWNHVGFRLPQQPDYQAVTEILDFPLLMTSINPSGQPSLFGEALNQWISSHGVAHATGLAQIGECAPSTIISFDPMPNVLRGQAATEMTLPGKRVLILCSGNICRSPVAEHLLRELLANAWQVPQEQLADSGWMVASAGTFAVDGGTVSQHSYTVGQEIGLDLSAHRSQHVDQALQQPWDLILGMGPNHLAGMPPELACELFDPTGHAVPDPFGGELPEYENMRNHLMVAARNRVAAWSEWPQDQS